MKAGLAAAGLGLLALVGGLSGQDQGSPEVRGQVDWLKGIYTLDLSGAIPREEAVAPISGGRTEDLLKDAAVQRLPGELMKLPLSSAETLGDRAQKDPSLYSDLSAAGEQLAFDFTKTDRSYLKLSVRYHLDLAPALASRFSPSEADEVDPVLSWSPTRDFSGLVIYARGDLPLGGTTAQAAVTPVLLPRILDSDQETILDSGRVDPQFLKKWGIAAYSTSLFEDSQRDRIGYDPLRVVAHAVYGRIPGDLVLSRADSLRVRASAGLRRALSEGRVLIILSPPEGKTHE